MSKKEFLVALSGFLLSAILGGLLASGCSHPTPTPKPPPVPIALAQQMCSDIWQQELGRDIDPSGLSSCVSMFETGLSDKQIRDIIHKSDEYKQHQKDLEDAKLRMPRIQAKGQAFKLEGGADFTAIEASDFALYQKHLNGDYIIAILQQRQQLGFNMVRVFGMYNNPAGLGHFIASDYGDRYFTELPKFAKLLSKYKLYVEFVAFADTTTAMPSQAQQLAHWDNLIKAAQPITNIIVEAVNEADQPINRTDSLAVLPRPTGVFSSHGSNGSQAWPVAPYWDYVTFHTNGAPEWPRKVGHNCMEIWSGPCLSNETTRATDEYNNPDWAYDAAAGASLLAAGSAFHSVSGKSSSLFTAAEAVIAGAWVNGAMSIPLSCHVSQYKHLQDAEGTQYSRVYQNGDDPQCVARIRNPLP